MKKKANSLAYVAGSLLLIVAAIAITTIINKSSSGNSQEDIRAKAGNANTLQVLGTVITVDNTAGTFTIDNVTFASNASGEQLGTWTVTAPTIDVSSLSPGQKVTLTIDSSTFLITQHTMQATQVKIGQ